MGVHRDRALLIQLHQITSLTTTSAFCASTVHFEGGSSLLTSHSLVDTIIGPILEKKLKLVAVKSLVHSRHVMEQRVGTQGRRTRCSVVSQPLLHRYAGDQRDRSQNVRPRRTPRVSL